MNAAIERHNWSRFISLFGEQNRLRPTRIGVFEGPPDAMEDFWLEDGVPLMGIDIDAHGRDAPDIEIMLGSAGKPGNGHLTHVVEGAVFVKIILSASGNADSLEIQGRDGRTTVLQFEELPAPVA
jgi:hypothetical protein